MGGGDYFQHSSDPAVADAHLSKARDWKRSVEKFMFMFILSLSVSVIGS